MSTEFKRMQQRVGTYEEYQAYKNTILPNEFITVTSGSPDTDDGAALYYKIGSKEPKLIVDEDVLKVALRDLQKGGTPSAGISTAILAGANGTAGMVSEYEEGN